MPQEIVEVKIHSEPKDWQDHVKFGIEISGPIIATLFGLLVLRITKRIEQSQWRSQKIIEKRIVEWDGIRPELNDIFCYCTRVGSWKSLKPPQVIELKRVVDKKVHLARPYFSAGFFKSYLHFIKTCFEQYQGHAVDAKIRSPLWEHKNARKQDWDSTWDNHFFEEPSTENELWSAYEGLLAKVSEELETCHK